MTNLKLYIWDEFNPNAYDGLAFAIASSEKEAKKQIKEKFIFEIEEWGKVTIKPLNKPCARYREGGE